MAKHRKTSEKSRDRDEAAVPEEAASAAAEPSGRQAKFLRIVLMVGGALAAPSLALAAFFFTNTKDPAPVKQAGGVTTTTRGPSTPSTPSTARPAPTTTTTTTAPLITSAAGLRDPFAPLVSQGPPPGAPGR